MSLERVEQILNSVVELDVLCRIAAESLGDEVYAALRRPDSLLGKERPENLLYLHVDDRVLGVAAANRFLFPVDQSAVLTLYLLRSVLRAVVGAKNLQRLPELSRPLVGVDVDQGAV